MFKDLTGAKLGIFIFIGSVLLVVGIFMLGNKDQLFVSTFTIRAYFQNTEGLRNGASVRFGGIDVGAVKDIKIMADTSGRVEVSLRIKEEVRRFIKKDSRASIETEGLVGNKVVIISMGSDNAEPISDNGVILSKEPLSFADVIEETQGILSYTKEMTKNLADIVGKVNQGEGTIGKILYDEELYNAATNITKSADKNLTAVTEDLRKVIALFDDLGKGVETIVKNTNNVVAGIDTLLQGVSEGKGVLGSLLTDQGTEGKSINKILENFVQISEDTKVSASRLAENMEALKHNWLFKSYFEERGYWDKNEFEKQIDSKILELNEKIQLLDKKIVELKNLESK
ncbi:Putative ABC transport system substrate-binding protein [Ignavibacterium album JCM 16511]|uniref:Putative ABC transport system substrate-binding protein n=1 Tax=Ignavibacterium album (strain DSM 19864 / JCM 16511 / NBRC 101810 / Mat9-16) TaxID=945713 RepID=I0AH89_IGNAJ|nr:MlaD family protein [Ignavibacterium album]AFH48346.1 Putative ABC transport system substrate-binding protein [Ignavibacterium album JCM 16511]